MPPLVLIPFACGWGAQRRECASGPDALREVGLAEQLNELGIPASWHDAPPPELFVETPSDVAPREAAPLVIGWCQWLHAQVLAVLQNGGFPVVLGGDHSSAIGTWSAVAEHYQAHQALGMVWFDGHLDAHTPTSTPSGAMHGMPVATLLGHGSREATRIGGAGPKLSAKHLTMIGIRSFEAEEERLLNREGGQIVYMWEVISKGLGPVVAEAVTRATTGTKGFGISVDLDGFDPQDAPGVGSPEPDGFRREEGLHALLGLGHHPQLLALEIAEYNPNRDRNLQTARLVVEIIASLWLPVP
jgi:arginase